MKEIPADIGTELYVGSAVRENQNNDYSDRLWSWSLVSHYNFNLGGNVSTFAGIGVGVTDRTRVVGSGGDRDVMGIAFSPRFGVELWRHLRLTLDCRIACKEYNTIGITVGYVFGGGLK